MLFDQDIAIPEMLSADALTVTLMGERVRYSLRVKPADAAQFGTVSGVKLPAKIGASKLSKSQFTAKLGPDEWIVIADISQAEKLADGFAKAAEALVCSVTDISHRNVGFMISGSDAAKAINAGCALDLSLAAFPTGKSTRTVFENAPIMLTRTDETAFHLECWRSFGPYMRDFLAKIAADWQSRPA